MSEGSIADHEHSREAVRKIPPNAISEGGSRFRDGHRRRRRKEEKGGGGEEEKNGGVKEGGGRRTKDLGEGGAGEEAGS